MSSGPATAPLPSRTGRLALGLPHAAVIAVVVLTAALTQVPYFYRPDGSLTPAFAAAAAFVWAVGGVAAATSSLRPSAAWLGLSIVGQITALQLINAPSYGLFQHYLAWPRILAGPHRYLLLVPLVQTVLAVAWLWPRRRTVYLWLRERLAFRELAACTLIVAFSAVYASGSLRRYAGELSLALWLAAANGLTLAMAAASIPDRFLARLRRGMAAWDQPLVTRKLPYAAALFVLIVSSIIAVAALDRIPHITDEAGYYFQAKHFSVGRLLLPAHPAAGLFSFEKHYIDGDRWWSSGFPGWPAVLALGMAAGVPWIVNPLLGAAAVLLAYALVRRLYDTRIAALTILLLAFSPWFLFLSASYMTHPLGLALALAAFVSVEKARTSRRHWMWGLAAGAALGWLLLTRPLEALFLSPIAGLWLVARTPFVTAARVLAGTCIAGLAVGSLIFAYNHALTGTATYAPHQKWADGFWYPGADRLGFGPDVGNVGWQHLDPYDGHGLRDAITNTNQNFSTLNFELFGWSFGSILFAALFFWRRWQAADRLLWSIVLGVIGVHLFYWAGGGPDYGPRYWYQALVPLVVLTVRGIDSFSAASRARVYAFVAAASLVAAVTLVPWRALGKYHNYRYVRADVRRLAATHAFGHALVFVRGQNSKDYISAFILNPPSLDSPGTLYARDPGPDKRAAVLRLFPGRAGWVIAPAGGDRGFRVIAGPLPPVAPGAVPPAQPVALYAGAFRL